MKRRRALQTLAAIATAPWLATPARARTAREPSELPRVGLGTWRVFDNGAGPDVLQAFAALGGGLVDTAPSYANEDVIGATLAETRGAGAGVLVATKVAALDRRSGLAQIEASMRALCPRSTPDVLDLVQVHNLYRLDAMLDLLTGLKQDGRVRFVGVTHFDASGHDALERAMRRGVDFVQVNYSAGERQAERRVLPAARDLGVRVLVNRPFMGGDLLRVARGRHGEAPREGALADVARELGCATWAELFLKAALSHPAVTCVLPATSSVAHLHENVRATTGPQADERTLDRITRALDS